MATITFSGSLAEHVHRLDRRVNCAPTEAIRQAIEDQEDLLAAEEEVGALSVPHEHNQDWFAALFPMDAESEGTD